MLNQATARPHNRWIGGAILVVLGLTLLSGELFRGDWTGDLFLPALGGIFLLAGILDRNYGLLVPGGILSGLGVGVLLEETLVFLSPDARGAIVVLGLSAGFLSIMPLGVIFTGMLRWWPVVIGSVLACVGSALFVAATLDVPNLAGIIWPLALIALGILIIVQRR